MSAITRIETPPGLTEQVHQRLLSAICGGELPPGTRLTQEDLAESLQVSRQPVLQALRLLKKDGLVIDAGRRGLMVSPLEPLRIEQVYQVRGVLDGLAAREAARGGARLDTGLIGEGRKAVNGKQISPMIEADLNFHRQVYAASGNPLIAETAALHWQHIRRAMGAVLQTIGVRKAVWDEHEAILRAINTGDARLAERLAREHGDAAGRDLAANLNRRAEQAASH